MDLAAMPDFLCQDLPNLEYATFSATSIGRRNAHFVPSCTLLHVRALQLVASKIWLHIPADVTWEIVSVEAFDVLSFTFEDVVAFVRAICRFQICYKLAGGSFLADLFCEMGKQGLHWTASQNGATTTLCLNTAEGEVFESMSAIQVSCNK